MTSILLLHSAGFFATWAITFLFVYFSTIGLAIGVDSQEGPQKIHIGAVPRLGGCALAIGMLAQASIYSGDEWFLFWLTLGSCFPVFCAGLVEDITGQVSPTQRLIWSIVTGLLFAIVSNYSITDVGINSINRFLSFEIFSIIFTVLALATLSNAINIIDGLNGLAAGTAIISTASIFWVSLGLEDEFLCFTAASVLFSTFGFLWFNFPIGRIFLGDAGAYFLGAFGGALTIMLSERHEDLSPFFCLTIIVFPLYELFRSVARRCFAHNTNAFSADAKHLHSILFKLLSARMDVCPKFINSFAASIILLLPMLTNTWAIIFKTNPMLLITGLGLFVLMYELFTIIVVTMSTKLRWP